MGGWFIGLGIPRRFVNANSYSVTGMDVPKLFRHYDRDNSGVLEFGEFCQAVRRDAKLTKAEVSDTELKKLFDQADTDKGGTIGLDEFKALLLGQPPSSGAPGAQKNVNKTKKSAAEAATETETESLRVRGSARLRV